VAAVAPGFAEPRALRAACATG